MKLTDDQVTKYRNVRRRICRILKQFNIPHTTALDGELVIYIYSSLLPEHPIAELNVTPQDGKTIPTMWSTSLFSRDTKETNAQVWTTLREEPTHPHIRPMLRALTAIIKNLPQPTALDHLDIQIANKVQQIIPDATVEYTQCYTTYYLKRKKYFVTHTIDHNKITVELILSQDPWRTLELVNHDLADPDSIDKTVQTICNMISQYGPKAKQSKAKNVAHSETG